MWLPCRDDRAQRAVWRKITLGIERDNRTEPNRTATLTGTEMGCETNSEARWRRCRCRRRCRFLLLFLADRCSNCCLQSTHPLRRSMACRSPTLAAVLVVGDGDRSFLFRFCVPSSAGLWQHGLESNRFDALPRFSVAQIRLLSSSSSPPPSKPLLLLAVTA